MCFRRRTVEKAGYLYYQIKKEIKPLDMIFYRGNNQYAEVIQLYEGYGNRIPVKDQYTHVSIIKSWMIPGYLKINYTVSNQS
jgi:hypothetical protein